jgi:hypothetical protein
METTMKKLLAALFLFALNALPVMAADRLDGVLVLAADDRAALAQVAKTPERHVMIYFGDFQH